MLLPITNRTQVGLRKGVDMKRKQAGFTLIELLVVIGILAVLLAIVLVAINPSRQFRQANNTRRSADVSAILNAITQYGADNRGNLTALNLLAADTPLALANTVAGNADGGVLCSMLVPDYIASLPADPSSGTGVMPTTAANCTGTEWNTGYTVTVNAAGRITVTAAGEDPMTGNATVISVTR